MTNRIFTIIIAFTLLASGCFEVEESMVINKDGSGVMKIKYNVAAQLANGNAGPDNAIPPGMFDEDSLKIDFESADGVEVTNIKSYIENDKKFMEITVEFDSFENFSESDMSGGGFIGEMTLSEDGNGNLLFEREVCMDVCDEEKEETPNAEGMAKMLAAFNWTYEIKFPTKIISANTNINENNNSVTWTFTMGSVALENQIMTATFINPGSDETSNLGIILLLLILFGIATFIVMNREK